jgi:hypothetical protein
LPGNSIDVGRCITKLHRMQIKLRDMSLLNKSRGYYRAKLEISICRIEVTAADIYNLKA